jgi:hypothetical protein
MAPFFADLARLAAARPELPWLFFRRDLDWRWRSHRQVADHLARGAAAIREAGASSATALPLVGAEALAALFASLAAGAEFRPLEEAAPEASFLTPQEAKWPDLLPQGLVQPVLELPAARGNIDRYRPAVLEAAPGGALVAGGRRWSVEDLGREAERIADRLFAGDPGGKKIVHAGARLAPPMAAALVMAALGENKVLALEPYPPASVESISWCRPTHLVAQADEIGALVAAWSEKHSKRSRLRRVLAVGEVQPDWSAVLGVPVEGFVPGMD